jgi:hypothetical protein
MTLRCTHVIQEKLAQNHQSASDFLAFRMLQRDNTRRSWIRQTSFPELYDPDGTNSQFSFTA